ncbi:hypothetical protein ACFROC_29210 [Nocardia tengchongensis]|uniref:hypothetical protein n=1 Tax=Nocardia tengchongensis TaxID=2055889 RepID=UPI003697AC91
MDTQTRFDDIDGWDTLDAERRSQFAAIAEQVHALYPKPDDDFLRRATLAAVVRYWRGNLSLEDAGARLAQARRAEAEARAVARQLGTLAVGDGGSQAGTAAKLGVDRQALLKWLGLRK